MANVLVSHMRGKGMEAYAASDQREMNDRLRQQQPDIVLLDLVLREEDGLSILRDLRRSSDIPVIIITGQKRDEIDCVVGLELGADDYLSKPFGLHEVTARVRAVLRRPRTSQLERDVPETGSYLFGEWSLNIGDRTLSNASFKQQALTKGEYALLYAFLRAPGQILSREHLQRATRVHEDAYDRSIDVQILRLRRKLEKDPRRPELILTRRGAGYVLAADVVHAV
jgi:DNA-binding response OmpR family regulator